MEENENIEGINEQNSQDIDPSNQDSLLEENQEAASADSIQVHKFEQSFEEKLEFIYDIPLDVSAELGRIHMRIKEILSLKVGSVIEIEKLAGEPLEILINDKLICRGEVIVVNEKYGVRMTDIVDPNENTELKTKTTQS